MKKKNLLVVAAIAGLLSGPALADKKTETKTETKTEKTCTDKDGKTIACDDAAKAGNSCGANGCGGAATKTETKTETKKK
jgi:hypothetical protein